MNDLTTKTWIKKYGERYHFREECTEKILCLQWVKESWNGLSTALITKPFEACGISVNTDGSQDGSIHSLKDTGIASEAVSQKEKRTDQEVHRSQRRR